MILVSGFVPAGNIAQPEGNILFFKRMTKKVISVFVRSYIYSIFKVIVQFELNNQTSLRRIYFVLSQIDETPEWRIVILIAETLIFQTVDLAHSEICLVLGANPRQCL